MGFVHNYSGLLAVRWFLGFSEAGLFPGVSYLLSCWYKRSEFGVRMAIFFSAAALAGSFGGLLAAAIAKMDGIGGKSGWAWIFILEGLMTFVIGVASFWCVYDFPDQASFLSDVDQKRVLRRLALDQQASAEHEDFKMGYLWASLNDWKTYALCVTYMGAAGPVYAFSLFLPTIISELVSCRVALTGYSELTEFSFPRVNILVLTDIGILHFFAHCLISSGYSSIRAQLLTVPPYAAAAVLTVATGFIADRTRQRGICNITVSLLAVAGFSMVIGCQSAGAKYAGVFLGAMGIYPTISNTISWASNNTEGDLYP